MLAVAPHVAIDYNADRFVEELERLANVSLLEVGGVLVAMWTNMRGYSTSKTDRVSS